MARTRKIDNDAILEAARAVFLEHGLDATAQQVAERAGVSTGSIFNRFGTKAQLFQRALHTGAPPPWAAELPLRVGRGELRAELIDLAKVMLAFFKQIVPNVMLGWTHARGQEPAPIEVESVPVRALGAVSAYFAAEIALGRLRGRDPRALARIWGGALWNFVAMDVLFSMQRHMPMSEKRFVAELVDTLLEGCVAQTPAHRPKRKAPSR